MINPNREIHATRIALAGLICIGIGLYLPHLGQSRYGSRGRWVPEELLFKIGLGIAVFGGMLLLIVIMFGVLNHVVESRDSKAVARAGVKIYTRFARDWQDRLMFPTAFDPDIQSEWKYFLRLDFPDGTFGEFRCNPDLFFYISEGQVGTVSLRGNWIEGFIAEAPSPLI